ncbi:RagB/SusD family nutrient uptake outer membrane protein [Proteiniphilum sp. X52]|uniref:RagB/SusD family nutrient uptake outer membrane protein n=1 Tax=Proteiniphilum sp. X52 TaxID=2382159 RepID=UPI000F0A22CD|nr:RagB/SusD family nutrient uptake outer membrane protein [Proteiniphilum sp. X52]
MIMKIYKSILAIVIGVSVLSFDSCTDLSETIYDTLAAEKYEFTEKDAASMFAPVYSNLRNVYWGWNGYCDIQDESSDLWCTPYRIGIGWGDLYVSLHKHQFHSQIGHFWTEWNYSYAGINACNKLLADKAVQASEAATSQLRAYRALYYYILFDLFRNIPLDTTYDHPAGWMPEQADPQETWDFVIDELTDIKGKCGPDNGMGQINDYAVNMLLAKMYLNHNAWFNDHSDSSWYGKAIDEVNEIIESGRFSLSANYSDNFKEDISGSPEIIFGIPFENKYASGNYYANKWIHVAGRAVWDFNGWATGGSTALPQFLDTYDEDDGRYTACWTLGQQYDRSGAPIMVEGEPLSYTKEIHSIDNPGCYPFEGGRLIKYEILSGDFGSAYDDIPFFRLADAYMIKAECLLRLGGYKGETEQTAADLVTAVRQRAFKNNPGKAVRTVEQLKGGSVYAYGYRENQGKMGEEDKWVTTYEGGDDIELGGLLDDLAWEFVAEHHRRQDLIRFRIRGTNQNVYNGKSWFCKTAKTDPSDNHCDIFPIYKTFLDGNPNLVQNPGYGE